MHIDPDKLYAVVSGDIVGSSTLRSPDRKALLDQLLELSQTLRSWLNDAMPLEISVHSGDSWQFLLTQPGRALSAALFCRAFLRSIDAPDEKSPKLKIDARIAIGIGTVDFVPGKNVTEGDGEAFRLSGRLLAEKIPKRRLRFAAANEEATSRWDVVFELIDAIIINEWSAKRALAISGALREEKQEEIGELWQPAISQPTVNRHLEASCWPATERAILEFQKYWEEAKI